MCKTIKQSNNNAINRLPISIKKCKTQQSLSESPKLPERSTTKRRQEVTETSKQEEQSPIRPRRGETSKAMALS
ncbi:hypothetical protein MNL01_06120 [Bartonella krasnovii]|uniref:hypothetical protein n=1 Tax=Bartonella krasnovii TaxID=2267275 RepID=UPI001F4CE93E|nr:hypothetical protein [Bartonella krasnovii]UNF53235.1 hypothetical protein MNL01_06120 [Bartonella krasnovii]